MKRETFEEYLARGGKITKIPTKEAPDQRESVKSTAPPGPVVIMSLAQADLYYGERKVSKKTKVKVKPTIDLSALPPELRKKYVDDVISAAKEENN